MAKYRRITRIVDVWPVSDIIRMAPALPECLNKMYAAGKIDILQDSVVIHMGEESFAAGKDDVIVCNAFGDWHPYSLKEFADKYEPAPAATECLEGIE